MITLRQTSDLREVERLDREIIGEGILTASDLTRSTWWLARVDGQVAGFCGACDSSIEPESRAYFIRAAVLPGFRGKGIHRRMLTTRVRWARGQGMSAAVTETAPWNAPSQRNLIRSGFLPFRPDHPWQGDTEVYWRRDI